MIHVNDFFNKKICVMGLNINDNNPIYYDLINLNDETIISNNFLYFLFNRTLKLIFEEVSKNTSVEIEKIYDVLHESALKYIPPSYINTPIFTSRYEKAISYIYKEILFIIDDLNNGSILSFCSPINYRLRDLNNETYLFTQTDFAYLNKNGEFKLILFQPSKESTVYNIRTFICYNFWNEIIEVKDIQTYSFGSNLSMLPEESKYIPFSKFTLNINDKEKNVFSKFKIDIDESILNKNIAYEYCFRCSFSNNCKKRFFYYPSK